MSASDSVFLPNDIGESRPTSNESFTSGRMDRYSRFSIYLGNAIEDISSGVSEEYYVNYLGMLNITKKSRSVPGKIRKKMKTSLSEFLSTEIKETITEEKIKENLLKLEKLVDESVLDEGYKLWRPNGNVKDHMRSHLMEVKQKHKDQLEKEVREKEQDIECVLRKVIRLRTNVRSLESRLHMLQKQCADSSVVDRIDKMVLGKVEELH